MILIPFLYHWVAFFFHLGKFCIKWKNKFIYHMRKGIGKKIKHQLILLWDVEQFVLSLSVSLKIWTWKVILVLRMSSKLQASPTFKLLSFANVFHPLESSNLSPVWDILIRYFAGQTLPFDSWKWISPRFLFKSKCLLPNIDGIVCQANEKANVKE